MAIVWGIVGTLGLGIAIAIGLGGKETASEAIEEMWGKINHTS